MMKRRDEKFQNKIGSLLQEKGDYQNGAGKNEATSVNLATKSPFPSFFCQFLHKKFTNKSPNAF